MRCMFRIACLGMNVLILAPVRTDALQFRSTSSGTAKDGSLSRVSTWAPDRLVPVEGLPISRQINVDASGNNIWGDPANEPSVAVDPLHPNRLAVGWRQYDSEESTVCHIAFAYTRDGGRKWSVPDMIQPNLIRNNPVLRADATGKIYFLSARVPSATDLFMSPDVGRTWEGPYPSLGGSLPWFGIDRTGGAGHGNLYQVWAASSCCMARRFARSTDGGLSFEGPFFLNLILGTVTVSPDGALWMSGVDSSGFPGAARSLNAQFADQTPVLDYASLVSMGGFGVDCPPGGPNPGGNFGRLWVDADHSDGPTRGNVYLLSTFPPDDSDDPADVMFIRTADNGASWSAPLKVNDERPGENAWQWFGTLGVAPNGRLDAVWNDTSGTGDFRISVTRYSYSLDAGASWTPSVALTKPWNSWLGWPGDEEKIGNYYDLRSDNVGAHLVYAATFNGEQDVYHLRIGDYDCNGNSVGDATDIAQGDSQDFNANGIPDECECFGDLNGDLTIGQADLGILLGAYGSAEGDPDFRPAADIDNDGEVGQTDLGILLGSYGQECP